MYRGLLLILGFIAVPLEARVSLGQFGHWGAFREGRTCFAIAEPVSERRGGRPLAAFTGVAGIRPHFHARLSRAAKAGSPVVLRIGAKNFALVATGADLAAQNARQDARIVAAVRQSERAILQAVDARGRRFRDAYPLSGAPSAIDAAVIGCLAR